MCDEAADLRMATSLRNLEMTNNKDAPIKSQVSKGKNRHLKEYAGL